LQNIDIAKVDVMTMKFAYFQLFRNNASNNQQLQDANI